MPALRRQSRATLQQEGSKWPYVLFLRIRGPALHMLYSWRTAGPAVYWALSLRHGLTFIIGRGVGIFLKAERLGRAFIGRKSGRRFFTSCNRPSSVAILSEMGQFLWPFLEMGHFSWPLFVAILPGRPGSGAIPEISPWVFEPA